MSTGNTILPWNVYIAFSEEKKRLIIRGVTDVKRLNDINGQGRADSPFLAK